jgi:hypothetical protein
VTSAPASGAWPNEPAAFVPLREQPWSALSSNGWSHLNRASQSRIVSDATAPHSPSSVLEHVYPEGFVGGDEPAVDWTDLGGAPEIFVGFWWKPSSPWHGEGSGINKVLFAYDASHTRDIVLTMHGPDGGPYYLEVYAQNHPASSLGYLPQNVTQKAVRLGEWQRVEMRMSVPDGVIRWWIDGVLVGQYTGLGLAGTGFGEFQIAPTWGGGGSVKRQTDYFRYDHTYISGPG